MMNHSMSPQAFSETNTDWLESIESVGDVSRGTDDDREASGSRRSYGVAVREALWMVEVAGQRISCELRYHGRHGVEYRLFQNNEFCQGRGFPTRQTAVQAAASVRRQLEDGGAKNGLSGRCETLPQGPPFGLQSGGGVIC